MVQVTGRDSTLGEKHKERETKRQRQGLLVDELSSSEQLNVVVYNLGNLARQAVQHQAEPRMPRTLMNQTTHIVILAEGSSLTINQWDDKLHAREWVLARSDDGHHWVGVRRARHDTSVKVLVDNCAAEKQNIWYSIFEVDFGFTSNGTPI